MTSTGIKFVCGSPTRNAGLPVEESGFPLPPFVHAYLSGGAPEGERNETIYKVAQQFLACRLPQSEAEARIIPVAVNQGGPKVEAETRQAIKSAYKSSRVTEPLDGAPVASKGVRKVATAEVEPDFLRAIKAAFQPHEWVAVVDCYQNDGGEWKPGKADLMSRADWEKWFAKTGDVGARFGGTPGGAYMAINPFREGSEARSNDNVSNFRHVLCEWDGAEDGSGKADQRARIEASNLPVTLLIDSGKKSIHAWIRVDAKTREEWEHRRDVIFRDLQCDPKNKDVARVSRCAGAVRVVNEEPRVQKLLAVNIGAKSWGEWETKRVGLPAIINLNQLAKSNPQATPEVIKGVLNMGLKLLLAGPSKARKSWCLLDLALSVVLGRPWLGFDTHEGRVLYINFELKEWMLWDRITKIAESRGMMQLGERGDWLSIWNLRGRIHDIAALTAPLIEAIKGGGYSLVVMDPAYKAMGDRDENAAGDINKFQNEMEAVCAQTGAAFVLAHHFAKGNSREKTGIDRMSGSGVWARDPDAVLTMTPPEPVKEGKEFVMPEHELELELSLRAHPAQPMRRLYWKAFHFEADSPKRSYVIANPKAGTYADRFGPIIRLMPEFLRADAEVWLENECGISSDEAKKAFDALKKGEYGFLNFDVRTKLWRGAGMPF